MNNYIDIYCERIDPNFWAEPLNATSNLAFFIAGCSILWMQYHHKQSNIWVTILAYNTILIGIGSFLFHTYATVWALWADVLPIILFMSLTLLYFLRYLFGLSWIITLLILSIFTVTGFILQTMSHNILNGSLGYAHGLLALLIITMFSDKYNPALFHYVLIATCCMFLSLILRSIDMLMCDSFPIGTHFLWHWLNGCLMWWILRGIMVSHKSL